MFFIFFLSWILGLNSTLKLPGSTSNISPVLFAVKPGISWGHWTQEVGYLVLFHRSGKVLAFLFTFLLAIPWFLFNFCWLQNMQESYPGTGDFTLECLSGEDKHPSPLSYSFCSSGQGAESSSPLAPQCRSKPRFWVGSDHYSDYPDRSFQISHSWALLP